MTTGGDFDYKAFRKDWDNLLERQKYKEAEKLCHEGLAKSPLDQSRGRLYNHLGYLYENFLDDKTFDDILEHYVLSLQVDESNANSHYNLANFLLEQGMQHLLRALELHPNHGKANKRYANLTPIKANTTLDLGGHKYQVIEVVDDGVRAIRLRKRNDGGYERSDDDPVYVQVSEPQKVYDSSSTKKGKNGRTNATDSDHGPSPLNIDDPNNNNYAHNRNKGCCFKCVMFWWFWALLWIIAVGGVVVPVLGYLIFSTESCKPITAVTTVAANTNAQNDKLNILFLTDCNFNSSTEFNQQYDTIDYFLSNITAPSSITIDYNIVQYCGADIPNNIDNLDLNEYDGTASTPDTQSSADSEEGYNLSPALEACQYVYNQYSDDQFLCIPFVSNMFDDPFDAMEITANPNFANIYLSFIVYEEDPALYATLGSFATSTECIAKSEEEAYGNSWWSASFSCEDDTNKHSYCPHCFYYDDTDPQEPICGIDEFISIFEGEGVTENTIISDITGDEECTTDYEEIYFYCIGAVVPLLFWVFIAIIVLCCNGCNNRNRDNIQQSMDNNDRKQQTAYV